MNNPKKADSALTIKNTKLLKEISHMGMGKVDPADIRPSQILLAQKMSDYSMMVDRAGEVAKDGDYFHTGKREILKTFPCHFLFAAKGTYVDRREMEKKETEEEIFKPQYSVIGVMQKDLSMFGMTFRSSALWALSSLFSAVASQGVPMFSFICTMETKQISGKKGSWFVPVCRVGETEGDPDRFDELYKMASKFDEQTDATAKTLSQEENA